MRKSNRSLVWGLILIAISFVYNYWAFTTYMFKVYPWMASTHKTFDWYISILLTGGWSSALLSPSIFIAGIFVIIEINGFILLGMWLNRKLRNHFSS